MEVQPSRNRLDADKVAWFADVAPSLLTNRTVRRYLAAYSQHAWPEAVKLILIYGILGLEQQFPAGPLSIAQLRALVERGGAGLVVERNLPGLQRQILTLQSNLDAVFDRLTVEALPPADAPPAALAGGRQKQQRVLVTAPPPLQDSSNNQGPRSALNPGPVAPKPSGGWRQGEASGYPSPPRGKENPLRRSQDNQGATNPIYPDWWLAGGPPAPPVVRQLPAKAPRQQPRLAYSVPRQQAAPSPAADDLVTPEWLVVPGSGYGQQLPAPVVAGRGPDAALTRVTAHGVEPAAAGPREAAAAGGGTVPAAAAARPAVKRRLLPAAVSSGPVRTRGVQSKIKADVEASRLQAAARQQQRQVVLASALAPAAGRQQRPGGGVSGGTAAAAAEALTACPSAAAADHFLSNPWTAWFMAPAGAGAGVDAAAARSEVLPVSGGDDEEEAEGMGPTAAAATGGGSSSLSPLPEGDEGDEARAEAADSSMQAVELGGIEEDASQPELLALAQQLRRLGSSSTQDAAGAGPLQGVFADVAHSHLHPTASGSSSAVAQQQQQPRRQAWAADFGHLDKVDEAAAASSSRAGSRSGSRQHKKWSDHWVGDFGHLEAFTRFGAVSTQQQQGQLQQAPGQEQQEQQRLRQQQAGADSLGKLFMSPADLQKLMDAAGRLQQSQGEATTAAAVAAAVGAEALPEPERAAPVQQAPHAEEGIDDGAPESVQALTARFSGLLARLDAQAAAAGEQALPAGVAARVEAIATHARAASISSHDSFATGSSGGEGVLALAASVAAASVSAADEGDVESYLEGLQETSSILQAALTRHDALIELIGSMQAGPTPGSDA